MPPLDPPIPPKEAPATPPVHRVSRGRRLAARLLVFVGVVFLVVSLLSNFVKREALDNDNFRTTSEELVANDVIRNRSRRRWSRRSTRTSTSPELKDQLPENLKASPARSRGSRASSRTARRANCLSGRACNSSS